VRTRYTSVAISLHWLIAILLIGLIAVGKYMNELEETDHLRFELIQWHKSFGILVLLLIIFRIGWRIFHKPPRLSSKMPRWEKFAASSTHVFLYLLMLIIPISGWVMVSASPLNLTTELFGAVTWPHLPLEAADGFSASDRETIAGVSHQAHHLLANGLLLLVLLHIAAALRHQFLLKDNLLSRMWVSDEHRRHADLSHALLPGILLAGAVALYLWNKAETQETTSNAETQNSLTQNSPIQNSLTQNSIAAESVDKAVTVVPDTVGFTAVQMGEPVNGKFESVSIELKIAEDAGMSVLNATVETATVNTGDGQIDSTVATADWFASEQYPLAEFRSTKFEAAADTGNYSVTGDLTIRDNTRQINFLLITTEGSASGEFSINRADFGIGTGGQDEFIDSEVAIRFETQIPAE
jgi:cytochrome b561